MYFVFFLFKIQLKERERGNDLSFLNEKKKYRCSTKSIGNKICIHFFLLLLLFETQMYC